MPTTSHTNIPYYAVNKLIWRWRVCSGEDGCSIVRGVSLSMDRAPPPLPSAPKAAAAPKPPAKRLTSAERANKTLDDLIWITESFSRFKKWLDTPDPPKQPKPALAAKPERKEPTVPPFDIQEIPGAMRKLWMPVSAKLMERWFASRLNYSLPDTDEENEINQEGQPYPADMYDMSTIKLDWVLKYERAKEQYDAIQRLESLTTPRALDAIGKVLGPMRTPYGKVDAWKVSGRNLRALHKRFQFQRAGVESSFSQKIHQIIVRELYNSGIPDDLSGALGSFNFCAAIGHAEFNRNADRATISSIIIYIKDNYTFTDGGGNRSQYLGHWSRKSFLLVPAPVAADVAGIPWLDFPVAVGDIHKRDNVYYPVRNRSFREWQRRHQRGGDFIIYSDYRCVTLAEPIEIRFL